MKPYFSLWDVAGGNLVNTYSNGQMALRVAAELIDVNGLEYANDLELSWTSSSDETRHIAIGEALVALTRGVPFQRPYRVQPVATRPRRHPARERIAS